MNVVVKHAISQTHAHSALRALLIGGSLDEFRVFSVPLMLKFMNSELVQDRLIAVDVAFSCAAGMTESKDLSKQSLHEATFSADRAVLLPKLYALLGSNVEDVLLGDDARLVLVFPEASLSIQLLEHDLEDEEWVWKVSTDDRMPGDFVRAVSCIPIGDGKTAFVSAQKGVSLSHP